MPFGLLGAPALFQHVMDTILRDLPFVTTYLDDVLITSPSIEEHESHLKLAFVGPGQNAVLTWSLGFTGSCQYPL